MHKQYVGRNTSTVDRINISLNVALAIVFVASCLVYSNTLNAEFVYDDSRAILGNQDLKPETPLKNVFFNDFWGTPLSHSGSHKSYRPLCVLSFRLNYYLGELNSFGYHLFNVLLHGITSSLFTYFCFMLFGKEWLAFFGGLLFAVHPIHTEAVAGVVGRADVGAAMFFLISLICYQYATSFKEKPFLLSFLMHVICITTAVVSMFTKELGATALMVCVVYEMVIVSKINLCSPRQAIRQLVSTGGLRRCILLSISTICMLYFRFLIMGYSPPEFSPSDNPAANDPNFVTRLLTFLYLPLCNMLLLVYPWELSYDWSQGAIPLVKSVFTLEAASSILFYVTLFIIALIYLNYIRQFHPSNKTSKKEKQKIVCDVSFNSSPDDFLYMSWNIMIFSIALMVLTFLPATNLFFYVGFVIAERVLYIPSIGFILLMVNSLNVLTKLFPSKQKNILMLMGFVLVMFSTRTYKRNFVWKNEEALYRSGIETSPAKSYGNLANVFMQQNKTKEAEEAYRSALKYRSNMADTHYNLGILLQKQQRYDEAIKSYKNAIKYRPRLALAHLNLGLTYSSIGKKPEALNVFMDAYNISDEGLKNPRSHNTALTNIRYNAGKTLYELKKYKEAVKIFLDAIKKMPDDYEPQSIYNLIGMCYEALEENNNAEAWYVKAIHLKEDHVPAILSHGQLLMKVGAKEDDKESIHRGEDLIKKAISLQPNRTDSYIIYGQQLHKAARYTEAVNVIKEALTIEEENISAITLLAIIYRDMKDYNTALFYQEYVARLNSQDALVLSNLGALYHILKRHDEAMETYNKALTLQPTNEILAENIRKLRNVMKNSNP